MKSMPYIIKQKLRQYANVQIRATQLAREIDRMIEGYGVPVDNLTAMSNGKEPQTEALAFLHNGECGNIEETIGDIEKVFLWFVNNQGKEKPKKSQKHLNLKNMTTAQIRERKRTFPKEAKEQFPIGCMVKMIKMEENPFCYQIEPGTLGIVTKVDDDGYVWVQWDDRHKELTPLSLIFGSDVIERV